MAPGWRTLQDHGIRWGRQILKSRSSSIFTVKGHHKWDFSELVHDGMRWGRIVSLAQAEGADSGGGGGGGGEEGEGEGGWGGGGGGRGEAGGVEDPGEGGGESGGGESEGGESEREGKARDGHGGGERGGGEKRLGGRATPRSGLIAARVGMCVQPLPPLQAAARGPGITQTLEPKHKP